MKIEILGTGCPKCKLLEQMAKKAIEQTGVKAEISKVEDFKKIIEKGVMATPALVIDDKLVAQGRIPSVEEISKVITK